MTTTVTKYVDPTATPGTGDGSIGNPYASAQEAQVAEAKDISVGTGTDEAYIFNCLDGIDTTQLEVTSPWVTDAGNGNTITFYGSGTGRCAIIKSRNNTGQGYLLSGAVQNWCRAYIGGVIFDGIEVYSSSANAVISFLGSAADQVSVNNSLVWTDANATNYIMTPGTMTASFSHTMIVTAGYGMDGRGSGGGAVNLDHCGIYGTDDRGLLQNASTSTTNVYVVGFTGAIGCFYGTAGTFNHNASSDNTASSADPTTSWGSIVDTSEFVSPSITMTTADFTLLSGASLIGAGSAGSDIGAVAYSGSGITFTDISTVTLTTFGSSSGSKEAFIDSSISINAPSTTFGEKNAKMATDIAAAVSVGVGGTKNAFGSSSANASLAIASMGKKIAGASTFLVTALSTGSIASKIAIAATSIVVAGSAAIAFIKIALASTRLSTKMLIGSAEQAPAAGTEIYGDLNLAAAIQGMMDTRFATSAAIQNQVIITGYLKRR